MNIGIDEQTKARLDTLILGFERAKSSGCITEAEQRTIRELNQRIQIEINLCNDVETLKFWELLENALHYIKKQLFRQESLNNCLVSENTGLKVSIHKLTESNLVIKDFYEGIDNRHYDKSMEVMRIKKANKSLLRTNNRLKNDRKTEKRVIRKSRHAAAVAKRNKARTKAKGG